MCASQVIPTVRRTFRRTRRVPEGVPTDRRSVARLVTGLLLGLVPLTSACRAPDDFVLSEAGFSVRMPGAVRKIEDDQELWQLRLFQASVDGLVYAAGYFDNLGVDITPKEFLDAHQSGYVGTDTLVHQAPIQLNGYPGRDLQISGRGLILFLRLYCVGRRMYTVSVLSKDADASQEVALAFSESFQLQGSSPEPAERHPEK